MARPLRIEYQGAVYHITSRGDRREPMALDDVDRSAFIEVLAQALKRFDARAWAYCLMGDHYHLVLHTRQANLSRLMRHVNGVYTQTFNRRHGLVGHLFQGRFKAIVVDADSYLLEVCRYVDLNPCEPTWSNTRMPTHGAATEPTPGKRCARRGWTASHCTRNSLLKRAKRPLPANMPSSWRKAQASICGTTTSSSRYSWAGTNSSSACSGWQAYPATISRELR